MTNVTVLGMGIMGAGMAQRLLDKGFAVTVWNRNPARSAPLGEAGARIAANAAEAVEGADTVVAMLAEDDASRAVWLGEAGALAAMKAGAVAQEIALDRIPAEIVRFAHDQFPKAAPRAAQGR